MSDKRSEIWATLDAGLTKWMSKAYESGKQDERERIIKLLETVKLKRCHSQTEFTHHITDDLIALIKGENK